MPPEVRRLLAWVFAIQAGLAAIFILIQFTPDRAGRLQAKFQFDPEMTFNTWWQVCLRLAAAGVAVLAIRHGGVPARARRAGWVLVGLLVFMSVDEQVGLHEALGPGALKDEATLQWVWPVLYSPVLILATWAIIRVAAALPRVPRLALLGGLALQGLAVVLEVSASQYLDAGWPYTIEVLLEESSEGFGAGLMLVAFAMLCLPVLRRVWVPAASPAPPQAAAPAPRPSDGGLALVRSAVIAVVLARHLRRNEVPTGANGNGHHPANGNGHGAAEPRPEDEAAAELIPPGAP
jgi:hypothetical protein